MFVRTQQGVEPKEQFLAIFFKGWMGMGKTPLASEQIGMPDVAGVESNMPVLERHITGGQEMRPTYEARLDGSLICGATGAFTPANGRDYELVVSLPGTTLGGNGRCGLMLYELVAKGDGYERQPLMMTPFVPKKNK